MACLENERHKVVTGGMYLENYQWEGITQFIFPEEVGCIDEVVSVNVKPQWQQVDSEDSLRLIGIYHIQSVIRFNSNKVPNYSEGILIEHLDFDGNEGYFEYAYPLEVDLPKELVNKGKPRLEVSNIQFFVLDGSCCTFRWDVQCIIEEEKIEIQDDKVTLVHESSSSSSKSFHESIQIPEHIENNEYELNLKQLINHEEQQEEVLNKIELEIQKDAKAHLNPVEEIDIVNEQNEEKIEQEDEPLTVNEQRFQPKEIEIETKNVLEDNAIIQEGTISNLPLVREPVIIKGKQVAEKEEKETDDFLESLTEDFTVFNLSNNIFRK